MRRANQLLTAASAALLLAGPAAAATGGNQLEQLRDSDLRVAAVGYRLFTRNHALCQPQASATGLVLHSLRQYGSAVQEQALRQWKFPSPVSIAAIVPGSPADAAGLRPGDGIEAIGERTFTRPTGTEFHATFQRDQAEQYLSEMDNKTKTIIYINRDGKSLQTELKPAPACRSRLEVVAASPLKARSDGQTIQIGQEFSQQLDEAELAFVLAHELVHTIRGHRQALARLESQGTKVAKRQRRALARQFEDEADLLALRLLANAGWDPVAAPRFMRNKGGAFEPLVHTGAHRPARDRTERMERALAQMPQ